MYDIGDNKRRHSIMLSCKKAGLHKLQYSIWIGKLSVERNFNLRTQLNKILVKKEDKICIFEMSEANMEEVSHFGIKPDLRLFTSKTAVFFL